MADEASWQIIGSTIDDDRFVSVVREVHESLFHRYFAEDPAINAALGVDCRAFRRLGDWRVMLVITPWMLARLLFPERAPKSAIPPGWNAAERAVADYEVLGPVMEVALLGQSQRAHLNFHPRLGHYLLHPLCLNMVPYETKDDVFEAWNHVINTRDRNMERMQRECGVQKEISRRELFKRASS